MESKFCQVSSFSSFSPSWETAKSAVVLTECFLFDVVTHQIPNQMVSCHQE